jgi:sigma-B regulation protein RsbU (phosphoserine phosphatase)
MHMNRLPSPRVLRWILELVCVFAACLLAGEMGLSVPFTSGTISPVWPAAGVALAAILLCGYRIWPAVILAAFVVNFYSGIPHLAAAGTALGSTAGPLCGAWLLRQMPDFRPSLTRLRDVLGLSICGAVCGTIVSATIGTAVLALADGSAWHGFLPAWLKWWWGDATGVLIVTPLVLTFRELMTVLEKRRRVELAFLLLGTVCSAMLIFGHRLGSMHAGVFAFGVFPFMLWGAIRFEVAGSAVVSFLSSAIAVWGTAHGFGLVIYGNVEQNAMLLQAFIVVTSVSGVVLAAVIAERAELIRKQSTLEALEHSEKNYRGIVETAYEGIWKVNADLETTLVNGRMAELLGYTVQEMMGRPLFDFMFEKDIEQKKSQFERRRHGVSEQIEIRYRRKDGKALWARVTTSPIIGEDGSFEGALAMVSDMTEQKRAASERRRSQETISLLSRAVEQTADSVVITDRDGTIEYVNPAFEVITGYSRLEVVGKTPGILKSNLQDKAFYNQLWGQILQGEDFHGTLVDRKKSGELYWAEQTISPIKGSDGVISHFVSVCKDVTALREQQERELQLQMARNVQQRFYTGAMTCATGFDIASAIYPAKEACGDYLDVFSMPDGRTCIGIGDVSGHGLDSALVMALTRAYVRAFAQVEADLANILLRVNHMLIADLEDSRFVTMLLVCLDGTKGCLSYANAGHVSGFLMNSSGEIDHALESSGPPLGLFSDSNFVTSTIPLTSQHLMILLTDGTTEMATPGDMEFGTGGALEYVRAHRHDSANELVHGIYRAARSFAGDHPQQDDATGVIVRVD